MADPEVDVEHPPSETSGNVEGSEATPEPRTISDPVQENKIGEVREEESKESIKETPVLVVPTEEVFLKCFIRICISVRFVYVYVRCTFMNPLTHVCAFAQQLSISPLEFVMFRNRLLLTMTTKL